MIISAIYTDLFIFISPSRAFCLYRHSYTIFVHYHFFSDFLLIFFAFAMLSHEVYIHRCELKTSLVERIISASEKVLHTISGTRWISRIHRNPPNSRRIQWIRFGTSGTTALVLVSMYKYVNMLLLFFFSHLSFCRAVNTTFFLSSRQNSRETLGADDVIGASDSTGRGRNVTSSFSGQRITDHSHRSSANPTFP